MKLYYVFRLYLQQAQVRVLDQKEEQALLKAYIIEWRKFFTQSNYLPLPFRQLETIHVQVRCNGCFSPSNIAPIIILSFIID